MYIRKKLLKKLTINQTKIMTLNPMNRKHTSDEAVYYIALIVSVMLIIANIVLTVNGFSPFKLFP